MIAQNGLYFAGSRDEDGPNPLVMIAAAIFAPIAASLINLAISRSREYEADATGAELCGKPLELADALAKIERGAQVQPMTDGNPAYASSTLPIHFRKLALQTNVDAPAHSRAHFFACSKWQGRCILTSADAVIKNK